MSHQAHVEPQGLSSSTHQLNPQKVCALSLLPVELVDLPAVQLQPDMQCLVSLLLATFERFLLSCLASICMHPDSIADLPLHMHHPVQSKVSQRAICQSIAYFEIVINTRMTS